jgi:tetratricopeptide (TPR) repeat protein
MLTTTAALLGLSVLRAAASPAPVSFEVDPRVELAAVVVMLADPAGFKAARPDGLDAYAAAAEAAFSPFAGHPAVARVAARRKAGAPASAFVPAAGEPLPDDLRDFQKASGFAAFFAAHRKDHEAFAETARRESLRAARPEDALAYMGLPYKGKLRFILAPLLPEDAGDAELGIRAGVPARGEVAFGFDSFEGSVAVAACRAAANWFAAPAGAIPAHLAAAVGLRLLARDLGEDAAAAAGRRAARLPHLAAVAERLKEYEGDRARYPTVKAFSPRIEAFAAMRLEQAAAAARAGERGPALALLAEARAQNPDAATQRLMVALYQDLKDDASARTVLAALAAASPRDARLRVDLAALAARAGDRGAALSALGEAEKLTPESGERLRMALLRQDLKDFDGALSLLDALVREQPKDAALRGDLGLCRYLSGRPDEALADLKAAIKLDPAEWPASLTLGAIYAAQARYDLSIGVYDSALRVKDGRPAALKDVLSAARAESTKARGR